jgi:hypothetical protein
MASGAGGGSGCAAPVSGGGRSSVASPRWSTRERSLWGSPALSRGAATRKVDGGGGATSGDLHRKQREVRRPATGARGGTREVSMTAKAERKRRRRWLGHGVFHCGLQTICYNYADMHKLTPNIQEVMTFSMWLSVKQNL